MAKKVVSIDIPVNEPDDFVNLSLKFLGKHETDGAGSPLSPLPMAIFKTKAEGARDLRKEAKEEHALADSQSQQSQVLIGIAEGQNSSSEGTLYNYTIRFRKSLLAIHDSNPEDLSLWGFSVQVSQTGGKRTVKVDIPVKAPGDFLTLCDEIFDKHTADGATSALNAFDMADFETKKNGARTNRDNAENNRGSAQAKNQQAEVNLGIAEGQTRSTTNTCYNILTRGRDLLLALHQQNEENLNAWGFKVVISEAKSPTAKHAKSLTIIVKSAAEGNPTIEGATITPSEGDPAQTDENGQITVPKPLLGTATFTVSAPGHVEQGVTYEIKKGDNVVEVILEVAE